VPVFLAMAWFLVLRAAAGAKEEARPKAEEAASFAFKKATAESSTQECIKEQTLFACNVAKTCGIT